MTLSFFKKNRIYADWAATTPIHPRVLKAMKKVEGMWANPSAIHREGVVARKALEERRARSARLLGVKPEEIYFTSGGTEANATIIQGVLRERLENGVKPSDVHVVSTSIEHSSILETLKFFEGHGVKVTYVAPASDGVVRVDDMLAAITPQTALVTCMYANNEIGTIQPVSKIGAGVRKIRAQKISRTETASDITASDTTASFPVFHVDASQAPLWLSCEVEGLRADAVTLDAHKMQGPKGIGALIVRRHVSFKPLMIGGGQERGQRPTTESLSLIAGFTEALAFAQEGREARSLRSRALQQYFFEQISKNLTSAVANGLQDKRLPNNVNISLPEITDPEFTVLTLDRAGIACSTKSSCLKGEEKSCVVASLGGEPWRARKTLRFTLDPDATKAEVNKIISILVKK
ncbi:MAG: hypothetical protein RLZZ67_690 [Candidatus Parcubacteria bacterium]|jgi:cysteine desulfurase